MKKPTLFVVSFLTLISCQGQISNSKILQALLSDSEFCRHVIPCKECDTIYVVDTLGYFTNTSDVDNKIVFTKKYIRRFRSRPNQTSLIEWTCSNLFIDKITRAKNRYRIDFFHTPTNGNGFIEFRLKKGELVKTKSQFGQF